jgi:DNA-binding winged helix-turn-helix (wHTH) protein
MATSIACVADARRRRLVLRFHEYELDAARYELRRRGRRVDLAPQPYDLLWVLASRDDLVTREEIRRALWGEDTFVEFDGCVNFAIRELRRVLGDDARCPRFIEARRGRGYRFVAPVEVVGPDGPSPAAVSAGDEMEAEPAR